MYITDSYLGLVSGEGVSFSPEMLAVYFACCICNPLMVVVFCVLFLIEVPSSLLGGESVTGRNGREILGWRKGVAAGNQTDQLGPLE